MSGHVADKESYEAVAGTPGDGNPVTRSASAEPHTGPTPSKAALQIGKPPTLEAGLMSQYERLASRVLFGDATERFTLVVTSALSGEGVTTTSVGVALALAESTNKAVLLVDANLRRPALHGLFDIVQQPGLHEMVPFAGNLDEWLESGRVSMRALGVTPTVIPNLFVLPSGTTLDSPTQLMTSDACRLCFDVLASRFAYVIIDCPPLLTAVDAGSVCRLGSGVAIVIRAGLTRREDVRRAQERLQGAPVMGVVLNGA